MITDKTNVESSTYPLEFRRRLYQLEPAVPIALGIHGVIMLLQVQGQTWQWALVLLVYVIGLVQLLVQDTPDSGRALMVAVFLCINWILMLSTGGTRSFFLLWLFVISAAYPIILASRYARPLPVLIPISYLLLLPLSQGAIPPVVVLARVFLLGLIGGITYRLRRILDEFAESHLQNANKLARRNEELALLNSVISSTAATLETKTVLQTTCDRLAEYCGIPGYFALIIDQHHKKACVLVEKNLDTARSSLMGLTFDIDHDPSLTYVLAFSHPLVVEDALGDLRLASMRSLLTRSGASSILFLPLRLHEETLGIVVLTTDTKHRFSARDLSLAENVAAAVSPNLINAIHLEAEYRARTLAETLQNTASVLAQSVDFTETLKLLLNQLSQVVPFDETQILLVESDSLQTVASSRKIDNGKEANTRYRFVDHPLLHRYMEAGQPVLSQDVREDLEISQLPLIGPQIRSWIGMPLVAWDVITGWISVGSHLPAQYSRTEVEVVDALANQAAIAIETSRIITELEKKIALLQETQRHLERTGRLSAATEIVAGIAHEINNPLTTIVADSQLLVKNLDPSSDVFESAQAIRKAADRVGSIVNRLLSLSRNSTYAMKSVNVNDTIRSAMTLIHANTRQQATIHLNLDSDLPEISGSDEHLEELWLNLLVNALDSIAEINGPPHIEVKTKYDEEDSVIRVIIEDNGKGIPADLIDRVFDPFFTTKVQGKGTGLGLSISRNIVLQHHGTIEVESVMTEGCKFIIQLPKLLES